MVNESNKIRAINTVRLAVMGLTVVISAFYIKVPGNILILKLLIVPMFWLSTLGLRSLYKNPISEQAALSVNALEYNALYVFLFSTFLLFICWTPEVDLSQILNGAMFAFLFGFPLSLYLHHKGQSASAV